MKSIWDRLFQKLILPYLAYFDRVQLRSHFVGKLSALFFVPPPCYFCTILLLVKNQLILFRIAYHPITIYPQGASFFILPA